MEDLSKGVRMPGRRDAARDDELIRYLLGELPEDDVERLDEQSVMDDEFAARLRFVEDDLVDAYTRGELTAERTRRFEAFYLASPRRREKVAFARRLLRAVEQDAGRSRAVDSGSAKSRWIPWALAAAVALCLAAGALVQQARVQADLTDARQRLDAADRRLAVMSSDLAAERRSAAATKQSLAQAQVVPPLVAVTLLLTPQTRGTAAVPVVVVAAASHAVPLALRVDDGSGAPFEAELRDPGSNHIVWRSALLAADRGAPATLVTVALPAELLKSQHYVIDLYARQRGRDFVDSYTFEAVRR